MTISPELLSRVRAWRQSLKKEDRWCVLINADPDAMASAVALKRLMHDKVKDVDIARINEVSRPDNLAMIRYLRIPVRPWQKEKAGNYNHFAMVDSQPNHHPAFDGIKYSFIVDHHPYSNLSQWLAPDAFCEVQDGIGATSTIMTGILHSLRITPGPLLATALLYGIRTDTGAFERSGDESDLKAYQWLHHHADKCILRLISRSEYLRSWLPFFSRAFRTLTDCRGNGAYAALNEVPEADLIVAVADFFAKVHGLKWIAVSGIAHKTVIVIFRGDGSRDMGRFADACFYDVGRGGGHRDMARAEFPLSAVPAGVKPVAFILKRLMTRKLRPETARIHNEPPAPPLPEDDDDEAE